MLGYNKKKLNNGREMPLVGLGTWKITSYEDVKTALNNAVELGYRHIDTAYKYLNEKMIGKVLKEMFEENKIKREDLFITSKLHQIYHENPRECLMKSLKDLQLDYLDLYMIHWPVSFKINPEKGFVLTDEFDEIENELKEYNPTKIWSEFEKFVDEGLVKSIGFSNHGIVNTKKILDTCRIKPQVSQLEFHPYFQQKELISFFKENDIAVVAHSCLARGGEAVDIPKIMEDPLINSLAVKYKVLPSQIILAFIVQSDIGIVPKAIERNWLEQDINLKELAKEDYEAIQKINIEFRFSDHPSYGPDRFL